MLDNQLIRARILLVVGGGIAAYKALELIRKLRTNAFEVTCILTKGGEHFVTPLSVQTLSEKKVYTDLFELSQNQEIEHITLSRQTDMIVVYPASANLIARAAAGIADDLATTVLLASPKNMPILIAPAMNVCMWEHPATQANYQLLQQRGILFAGPDEGNMACHESGKGRLIEPEAIYALIDQYFSKTSSLVGKKALVTAGPTYEPIDPVRFIGNFSSGRQGYAIAESLRNHGAEVTLITGPSCLSPPTGMRIVRVTTAKEMLQACKESLPVDIAVMAAAVSDWRIKEFSQNKLKKQTDMPPPALELTTNPDILAWVSQQSDLRPKLVVGFAAETQDVLVNAEEKRKRKQCDWIVVNNVNPETEIIGGVENEVTLLSDSGKQHWPRDSKENIAQLLIHKIEEFFSSNS